MREELHLIMKETLTVEYLLCEAKIFCETASLENHLSLFGITDGKAVGTYIEHKFQRHLFQRYDFTVGNSAKGIDLPDEDILTDIKVTSITQPQSSCPFRSARQKIFGLGYNLLVFVYEKHDSSTVCNLNFLHCAFIDKERTADFTTTKHLREMLDAGANKEDIMAFLSDKNMPGDDVVYNALADEIMQHRPNQGYLTISNALQWRLQYGHIMQLKGCVQGITNYDWQT